MAPTPASHVNAAVLLVRMEPAAGLIMLAGDAVATVKKTIVAWLSPLPLPVSVIGKVPVGVPGLVEMTSAGLAEPVGASDAGFGVNVALAPEGSPEAKRLTEPLKFATLVSTMLYAVAVPGATVCGAADAAIEKSGGDPTGSTVSQAYAARVVQPEHVPVTVML